MISPEEGIWGGLALTLMCLLCFAMFINSERS